MGNPRRRAFWAPQLEAGSAPPGSLVCMSELLRAKRFRAKNQKASPVLHVTEETRDWKSRFLTVPLGLPPFDTLLTARLKTIFFIMKTFKKSFKFPLF